MEQLIEEVRTRPVIWDSTSEPYRDVTLKDKAWDEIAEVLLKDKTSLKHQWKKLKDCHRQALLRRKTTTGQAAAKIKKWKYEDEMKFLLNTMMHRPSDSNIPLPNPNEEQGSNDGDQHQQEHLTDVQDDVDGDIESTADDVQTVEEITATGKERRNRSPRGIDKVLTFMQAKEKNKDTRTKSVPDEIDLFFASAAQSVRKLPRRLRNKVKLDLLNSICRAEEENELDYNPATTPRSHPSFVPSPSTTSIYSQSSVSPSTTPSPLFNESSLSETGYLVNSLNENVWERL